MSKVDSVESAGGRLGAVLAAPHTRVIPLGRFGPWVVATPTLAREVLTDPARFDFPSDVSRSGDLSGSRSETRSGHSVYAPLSPADVQLGRATFVSEWMRAVGLHQQAHPGDPYDAMELLRTPVARATTAATLPSLSSADRDAVARAVLRWIDALGPVIAARRPPGRWSRKRRSEAAARIVLEELLQRTGGGARATELATFLAAGTQVPIAAGAWLLAHLADHPSGVVEPVHAVWETLRLTPPTWITARITVEAVELGGTHVPSGSVVLVSPLLLGRSEELAPVDAAGLTSFNPDRWRDETRRPGAWLPFGAGPHACPGRNLGLAQLVALGQWAVKHELTLSETVLVDQSRGIAPRPCRFFARPRGGSSP